MDIEEPAPTIENTSEPAKFDFLQYKAEYQRWKDSVKEPVYSPE